MKWKRIGGRFAVCTACLSITFAPVAALADAHLASDAGAPGWTPMNLALACGVALLWVSMLRGMRHGKQALRLFGLVPAAAGAVAFLLTSNFGGQMALVDQWTVLMAAISMLQIGVALLCRDNRDREVEAL